MLWISAVIPLTDVKLLNIYMYVSILYKAVQLLSLILTLLNEPSMLHVTQFICMCLVLMRLQACKSHNSLSKYSCTPFLLWVLLKFNLIHWIYTGTPLYADYSITTNGSHLVRFYWDWADYILNTRRSFIDICYTCINVARFYAMCIFYFSFAKFFIARQHTDARYWYSNSVRPSVGPWRAGIAWKRRLNSVIIFSP